MLRKETPGHSGKSIARNRPDIRSWYQRPAEPTAPSRHQAGARIRLLAGPEVQDRESLGRPEPPCFKERRGCGLLVWLPPSKNRPQPGKENAGKKRLSGGTGRRGRPQRKSAPIFIPGLEKTASIRSASTDGTRSRKLPAQCATFPDRSFNRFGELAGRVLRSEQGPAPGGSRRRSKSRGVVTGKGSQALGQLSGCRRDRRGLRPCWYRQ